MTTSILVGISGATCSGKTTLTTLLYKFFQSHLNILIHNINVKHVYYIIENCFIVSQDDYFLPEKDSRHEAIVGLNHINWERIGALDMQKMLFDLENLKTTENFNYLSKKSETFKILHIQIILVEGFLIFEDCELLNIMQIKFHLHIPVEECYQRRIKRAYNPPDKLGYFEICVWPSYLEYYSKVKFMENITKLNGNTSINSLFKLVKNSILIKLLDVVSA